jgi:hypothetical protein
VRKWLLYKASPHNFDADSSNGTCKLAEKIYRTLWGWDLEEKLRTAPSDTMNTFWTTYKVAMQLYCPGMVLGWADRKVTAFRDSGNGLPTKADTFYLAAHYKRFVSENEGFRLLNELPYIREFASLTHTIGNFTLVPQGLAKGQKSFNVARYAITKDYWDLSLGLLKGEWGRWTTAGVVPKAGDFNEYADTYFMGMYLDSEGEYLPFFDGHARHRSGARQLLPASKEELEVCVKTINERIKCRGRAMAQKYNSQITS